MRELTESQKEFLKEYSPVDRHFTSMKEIVLITEKMELFEAEQQDVDMNELRDQVVNFYDELCGEDKEKWDHYMPSLQSVTTVIDGFIYKIA